MRKINLIYYAGLIVVMLGIVQGCQKEMLEIPKAPLSEKDLLGRAKEWHSENSQLAKNKRQKAPDLDISDLVFQWDNYTIVKNKIGNQVITVPIVSKGGSKAYYIELGLLVDGQGRTQGMIKEYMRSPYTGKTPMHIYTGTGHMFLSGVYDARKDRLIIREKSKSGIFKLEKLAKIASSGNSGSDSEEPPKDGGEIEEVEVIGGGGGSGGSSGGGGGGSTGGGGDSGDGDGSGGGVPTGPGGNNSAAARQAKQNIVNQKTKTDCDAVALAQRLASSTNLQSAINQVKNKTVEWGVPLKFPNPTSSSSILVDPAFTNNKKNSISFTPQWNSSAYHFGFIHNHPSGSGPSPSDIYRPMYNLKQMIDNNNITPDEVSNYIDNFASIVVSDGHVYTITIKNALFASLMDDAFNNEQEKIRYQKYSNDYIRNNNISGEISNADLQKASEYALMLLYGDQVHITKHKIGDTNKSEVIKRDGAKKVKTEKPGC